MLQIKPKFYSKLLGGNFYVPLFVFSINAINSATRKIEKDGQ